MRQALCRQCAHGMAVEPRRSHTVLSPKGFVVVAPLPNSRFCIVATAEEAPEVPSLEFMQAVLDARGPSTNPGRIHDVAWSSRFHIHHRVAETPRKGRILLCGDAAHVHSPAGGQGMNTGIQDSVSLAETLASTLKDGDEARLDSWAARRHQVARDVVALTEQKNDARCDYEVADGPGTAQHGGSVFRPFAAGARGSS